MLIIIIIKLLAIKCFMKYIYTLNLYILFIKYFVSYTYNLHNIYYLVFIYIYILK